MLDRRGWPDWMHKACASRVLRLAINGQHWQLNDKGRARLIPWGAQLSWDGVGINIANGIEPESPADVLAGVVDAYDLEGARLHEHAPDETGFLSVAHYKCGHPFVVRTEGRSAGISIADTLCPDCEAVVVLATQCGQAAAKCEEKAIIDATQDIPKTKSATAPYTEAHCLCCGNLSGREKYCSVTCAIADALIDNPDRAKAVGVGASVPGAEERLAWIREKAIEIFKDRTRETLMGPVGESTEWSIAAATEIYDKASKD